MYDNHITAGKFFHCRDILSRIYQGEDTEINLDELLEEIQDDYDQGKLSSSQYDKLISLAQDI